MKRGLVIQFYKDQAISWRWRMVASNGKHVACSGESFFSRANAKRAVKQFFAALAHGTKEEEYP